MNQLTFFDAPPSQRHSPTSVAAAKAIEPRAECYRRQVLEFIVEREHRGATDDEIEIGTGIMGNTVRPRRRELEKAGLVVKSNMSRKTRSNKAATVWVAKAFAETPF